MPISKELVIEKYKEYDKKQLKLLTKITFEKFKILYKYNTKNNKYLKEEIKDVTTKRLKVYVGVCVTLILANNFLYNKKVYKSDFLDSEEILFFNTFLEENLDEIINIQNINLKKESTN
jgi:hypothetical protein